MTISEDESRTGDDMNETVSRLGPLPKSEDPEFHSFTEDFEHRFFDGDEQVKVEVILMRETWDDLLKAIEENGWKQNEGLIILLTTGMAFLRAERALSVPQGTAGLSSAEIKKLLDRLTVVEARYASIKNFAFDVMRDHRTLELRSAPMERENLALQNLVRPLRRENDALKAEVKRLTQELQANTPVTSQTAVPTRHRWQRLWDGLKGGPRRVR
jgi:hypothetical protein